MMRKRHALISEMVSDFSSLKEFADNKREWLALFGVRLELRKDCVSIYFELGDGDYEEYFVISTEDGHLTVSNIVWWQNEVCANELLNIFTGQTYDAEDSIVSLF